MLFMLRILPVIESAARVEAMLSQLELRHLYAAVVLADELSFHASRPTTQIAQTGPQQTNHAD